MSDPNTGASSTDGSDFVPTDLDATHWENLDGLYRALLERELKNGQCLEQLLLDLSDLDAAVSEARTNLYIGMTCDTDDQQVKSSYLAFIENVEPMLKQAHFEMERKIVSSPHATDLDRQRYEVLLRDLRADVETFREESIPLQTEDEKLDQQFQETSGAMSVEFQGEDRTLSQMARFLEETDRATREAAWLEIWKRREQDREKLDEIFNRLITLRNEVADNAGFDNFRDYAFKCRHRFDYTPADCEAFHRAAEEVCVPVMRSLNAERAKALSVDPLRPWDLNVDIKGRAPLRPFEDAEELIHKTSKLFHRMDPQLGEMFDSLRTGDCLDLESRKGKAPGG